MRHLVHVSQFKNLAVDKLNGFVPPHGWFVISCKNAIANTLLLSHAYNGTEYFDEAFDIKLIPWLLSCGDLGVTAYDNATEGLSKIMIYANKTNLIACKKCDPSFSCFDEAVDYLNKIIDGHVSNGLENVSTLLLHSDSKQSDPEKENAALRKHIEFINTKAHSVLLDMAILLRNQQPNLDNGSFDVDGQSASELYAAIERKIL